MDIAALSIGLKQMQLSQAVGTSVLKLTMDNAQTNGQMMTQMLQSATGLEKTVQSHLGTQIDIRV